MLWPRCVIESSPQLIYASMVDLSSLLAPEVHLIPFLSDKVAAAGDGTPVFYSLPLPLPLAMLLNSIAFPPLPSSFKFVDCCVLCRMLKLF